MKIAYDPAKRDKTLEERGLDFEDAPEVFSGPTVTAPDLRAWLWRGAVYHIRGIAWPRGCTCMDCTR